MSTETAVSTSISRAKQIVEASHKQKIREATDLEKVSAIITSQIEAVVKIAGISKSVDSEQISQIATWVLDYYRELSPFEITIAFEMWSAGKFGEDIKLWGRPFNNKFVGEVLNAYKKKKSSVLVAYDKQVGMTEKELIKQEREEKYKEWLKQLPSFIRSRSVESWKDVFVGWHEAALLMEWYTTADYKNNALEYLEKARVFQQQEKAEQIESVSDLAKAAEIRRTPISEDRAKAIAGKMVFFDLMIKTNKIQNI